MLRKLFGFSVMCLSLFLLFGCVSKIGSDTNIDHTIKSKESLINILEKYKIIVYNYEEGSVDLKDSSIASIESDRDYSKTNTQVNGVDEADIVKTDGTFIYLSVYDKVIIARGYPDTEMEVVKTLEYDEKFRPISLYVDDNHLVVIGNYYEQVDGKEIYYYPQKSRVLIYDKSDYTEVDVVDIDGYVVTSRLVNDELLLVTNKYINYVKGDIEVDLPSVRINEEKKEINYTDIHYQEGIYPNSFVSLIKVNLNTLNYQNYTYLGSSSNVYVSLNNVYIAENIYTNYLINSRENDINENKTIVTKINYSDAHFGENKAVEVNGYVNNQFSMDEYNGMFRIASTTGWSEIENNLYIYDQDLNMVSKLEGIAKDERIQSVRFLGERIYLVTFRQVDPFFVIDASDAFNPEILGELKIPGYSTYLHPYDDSHIIGFGFDTKETTNGVRISGIKMTLFNVLDPSNPKAMFNEVLSFDEDGYGYSELSYNHKAMLFNKDKNLIAFPLTNTSYSNNIYSYMQSYKVYNIDLESGFTFKTDISHFDSAKENGYLNGYNILRGLYIEDTLYTVSYAKIMAHSLKTYEELTTLDLEFNETQFYQNWFGIRVR